MKSTHISAGSFGMGSKGRSWPRGTRGGSPAKMESLEERALFSVASPGVDVAIPVSSQLPAVQTLAKPGGTQGIIAILIGL